MTTVERLAVIDEQMKQNVKDHQTILGEVRHNCQANTDRFDRIEEILNRAFEQKADKWVEWYVKMSIGAIIVAALGVIAFLLQGHISF
jgi:hypothetical protein